MTRIPVQGPSARARTSSAGRSLRWLLGAQIVIALLLAGGDLRRVAPALFTGGSPSPGLERPIGPGDQIRRFAPRLIPGGAPRFPGGAQVPSRLTWEAYEAGTGAGLRLTGAIQPGDGARLAEYLDGRSVPVTAVALHSPGGSVADAMEIGRRLRATGVETRVGPQDACLSACPYILAGGVTRTVSRRAMVGVHQHVFGHSTVLPAFLAVEDIQRGQADVMVYLDEMGVDLRLVSKAMQTPPADIYVLMPDEMTGFALATTLED